MHNAHKVVLYQDGYISLIYDQATEVLHVTSPDIQDMDKLFLHKAFSIIAKTISDHQIKKFLLDSSNSISDLNPVDYKVVVRQFACDLLPTGLQKFARIVSSQNNREALLASYLDRANAGSQLRFEVRNFTDKEAAFAWLAA